MAKKKKIRVEMRKNRAKPPRQRDWTRQFGTGNLQEDNRSAERVRAKGDLSRHRTIIVDEGGEGDDVDRPAVDTDACLFGRVQSVHGLFSVVETEEGKQYRCGVRRLLRTMAMDERNVVATGDHVWFRPADNDEGMIERVEPRHGLLTRASRKREHVLVANVDQLVVVMALREPDLKPHLIDRYLASAEQGDIAPIICLNKSDLVDPVEYQSMLGMYSQLGVPVLLTSAVTGMGIDRLRELLVGRQSVFSGQSGVGKSSLLNAVEPELALRVRTVSETTQKGRHTTTSSQLIKLELGGWVVDTPGIRQFALWDIIPGEVEGFFAEFRPFVSLCAFPDCTHTHEERCAVKRAVQRRLISASRYTSYLGLFTGEE